MEAGAAWSAPGLICVFFVLFTLSLQLWPGASESLRFSRASYEQGALWQLLSAQWVHLSHMHAVANALAFVLIVVASRHWIGWPLQALALCGGYVGVAVVVALDPDCRYYAGASGALHGLLAGNAVGLVWASGLQGQPASDAALEAAPGQAVHRQRLVAMAVLGVMALKLWLQAGSLPKAPLSEWGFAVYHPAHLAGAMGGVALVSALVAARAVRAAKAQAQRSQ